MGPAFFFDVADDYDAVGDFDDTDDDGNNDVSPLCANNGVHEWLLLAVDAEDIRERFPDIPALGNWTAMSRNSVAFRSLHWSMMEADNDAKNYWIKKTQADMSDGSNMLLTVHLTEQKLQNFSNGAAGSTQSDALEELASYELKVEGYLAADVSLTGFHLKR